MPTCSLARDTFPEEFLLSSLPDLKVCTDIPHCICAKLVHVLPQLTEALHYKPEGRGFNSRCGL
jgi:hypothetical protein